MQGKSETVKCSKCKCMRSTSFFRIKKYTGELYKTCTPCSNRYKCTGYDGCNSKFSLKSDLKQHIKSVHLKLKDVKCDQCNYECSSKSHLNQHIKIVHLCIKDMECNQCNYKCSTKGTLNQHIKAVHLRIKDVECDQCNYKCSTKSTLKRHSKKCTGGLNISSGELQVIKCLEDLGFIEDRDYIHDSIFPELSDFTHRNLRPDFRFIDYKIIIEYNGMQHYKPVNFGGLSDDRAKENFKKIQASDKLKKDFCDEMGWKLITIPYTSFPKILQVLSVELFEVVNWVG